MSYDSSRKYPNYSNISNNSNTKTIKNTNTSSEVKHYRYKRNYSYQNLDKYRSISESPLCRLSESLGKYVGDGLTREDFYKTLLKNNIDPESRVVNKILNDLDKSGTSSTQPAIRKLIKIRNISTCYDNLADNLVISPKKQLLTSFETQENLKYTNKENIKNTTNSVSNYKSIKGKTSFSVNLNSYSNSDLSKVEDNFGFGHSSKRRFDMDSLGQKHHNESDNLIVHNIHSKKNKAKNSIKGITIKSFNNSINTENITSNNNITHKDKKIAFMQSSTAFKQEKAPLDNTKLTERKACTVMQNLSSKDTFSFFDSKHIKNVVEKDIISEHKLSHPTRYKNVVSEQNVFAGSLDKKKHVMNNSNNNSNNSSKIIGLYGKGKSELSNTEVNQTKTTYGNLFEWNIKKTRHDIFSPNKNSNNDNIQENRSNNLNNLNNDNIRDNSNVKQNRAAGNKGFLALLRK